jgi:hypothetical protein
MGKGWEWIAVSIGENNCVGCCETQHVSSIT